MVIFISLINKYNKNGVSMKRILNSLIILAMLFGLVAFQCSSTELTSAKLYIQQKNLKKAKEALLKEVQKNPKSDEGYYLLGFVLGEEGDYEGMIENYNKSLSISKKFEKKINESKLYHWANAFNKGVNYFNQSVKVNEPDSMKDMLSRSIEQFERAVLLEPDSLDSYLNLTYAYINYGDMDSAIKTVEKLKEKSGSAQSYKLLGDLYSRKGVELRSKFEAEGNQADSVKAVEYFNKAVSVLEEGRQKYPEDADILMQLSNAYIAAKKVEVAKEAFKAGVEKEPDNKFYRFGYGTLLLGANEFEEATKQLEKAHELDPNDERALYNLAIAYVKWGAKLQEKAAENEDEEDTGYKEKFEKALPYLEKYVKLHQDDGVIWDLLGRVYANLGMLDKSEEAFKKADELR